MNRASAASLTTAAQAQTLTVSGNDPPIASALFQISGTYGTAVLIFEGQLVPDGSWNNLAYSLLETPFTLASGNISPTDNTAYTYRVTSPEGLNAIRMRLVSLSSGTVTVNATQLTAKDVATQILPIAINSSATPQNITSTSATALTVGANGTTNPVFSVNANTASVATGLTIIGAAAAAGVALTVISSGTNEALAINAKGSGILSLNTTATGQIYHSRGAKKSPVFGTTTTALGTAQSSAPTIAQILGGLLTQTSSTGGGAVTLPTGTAITAGMPITAATDDTFECFFANLGGGQTLTITGATGTTVIGGAAVASAKTCRMLFKCTGANTWDVYCNTSA